MIIIILFSLSSVLSRLRAAFVGNHRYGDDARGRRREVNRTDGRRRWTDAHALPTGGFVK